MTSSKARVLDNILSDSVKDVDSRLVAHHEGQGQTDDSSETFPLIQKSTDGGCCYVPARYVLALWSFLGFVNMFTLRMDMNIAILDMVVPPNNTDTTTVDNVSTTSLPATRTGSPVISSNLSHAENRTGKFHWSEGQQDMVLSAFYYGYSSTQILGGYLSGRFGGKRVLGIGLLVTSLLALAIPVAAVQSYYLLVACRVGQGLAQGLAQPCMHTMWSNWAPENEKSKLMTITYSGCQLGTVVASLASGYLCDSRLLGGWPSVFYIFGGAGVIWSVHWLLIVYDKPCQHPRISEKERRYIEENIRHDINQKSSKPPWSRVLRSPALYAIIAAHFANDWGCFALTTCLPNYLQNILIFDIKQNGFLSSLPYLVLLVTNPLSGYIADHLRARNILSTKNTRKLINSIGLLIPSCLMLSVCFCDKSQTTIIVTLLTLAVGVSGFTMAGYSVNHLDIAPTFAGILYGLTNTIGTTTGFIGPAILAVLTDGHNTAGQWKIFFYLTSGIFFTGGLMFLLFAQGEPQNWWLPSHDTKPINSPDHVIENGHHGVESHSAVNRHHVIQDEDDVKEGEDDSDSSYDDVDWESLLAQRRAESAIRHAPVSSFSQILQSF